MDPAGEMRAFVRVVENRGFSAAAAKLEVTPSALSRLVTRLEDRLGVRLLQRTTRRLALTHEGEVYFARARQIVSDIDEVEIEVARGRGKPRGRLVISTNTSFGIYQLAPALPDFMARYPEIEVELSVKDAISDLVSESIDIAIRSGPVADTSLIVRHITDIRRSICVAPSYLKRRGTPRKPADLAKHDIVAVKGPIHFAWPFEGRDGIEMVDIKPRVLTDLGEVAIRLALQGVGLVRLGDLVLADPIRQGLLVPILTDIHHVEPVPMSAVYLPGRHRLPKMRVFLDFLIERFGNAPWRNSAAT
jgi:DNA-binding transcriptional LysR family regulator